MPLNSNKWQPRPLANSFLYYLYNCRGSAVVKAIQFLYRLHVTGNLLLSRRCFKDKQANAALSTIVKARRYNNWRDSRVKRATQPSRNLADRSTSRLETSSFHRPLVLKVKFTVNTHTQRCDGNYLRYILTIYDLGDSSRARLINSSLVTPSSIPFNGKACLTLHVQSWLKALLTSKVNSLFSSWHTLIARYTRP